MSTSLRCARRVTLLLALLGLFSAGCGDDDADHDAGDHELDASVTTPSPSAKLPRPSLPRPPTGGLPAELRPPR